MEFKNRLQRAASSSPLVPEYGHGQQVYLAKAVGVSQEAVRKWFAGESQPRKPAMEALAKLLNVEHVWLSLGVEHSETNKFRDVARRQDAGLYALTAYLITCGGAVAFAKDDKDGWDITCVLNAEVHKFKSVAVVVESNEGSKVELTPRDDVISVAAVQCPDWVFNWAFLDVSEFGIGSHAVKWDGEDFKIGENVVNNIKIG